MIGQKPAKPCSRIPDLRIQAAGPSELASFLAKLDTFLAESDWIRNRQEERFPQYKRPANCVILQRPDKNGLPRAEVSLKPDGPNALTTYQTTHTETPWFLPDWGFRIGADRERAHALLTGLAVLDLTAVLLKAAKDGHATVTLV